MNLFRRSLQARLLLAVSVAVAVFSLAAAALAYVYSQHRGAEFARRNVEDLERAMERTAAIALYVHDTQLMKEVVDGLARNPLVRSAAILDANGSAVARSAAKGGDAGPGMLPVTRPLASPFDARESLGQISVGIDPQLVQLAAASDARVFALGMIGQAVLVALIISLAASRLISRPIVRTARQLTDMRPGDGISVVVPAGHAQDEIGVFVRSVNDLLAANGAALLRERELRAEIASMEAQYRQIFDSTSAGIFVLDREGRLINGNPTVLRVIGRDISEMQQLRGQDFLSRVFARPDRVREMIEDAERRKETASADLELISATGHPRWSHCLVSVQAAPASLRDTTSSVVEGVLYDITERKRLETAVRRQADRDAVTHALSRAATEQAIDRMLSKADSGTLMTLLFIDLDGFKAVNDTLGHAAGDEVLREISVRLARDRRATDIVGRLGGDEFVVVLPEASAMHDGSRIAGDILASILRPVVLASGSTVNLGASIGLAEYPRHGTSREELLHAADEAMYAVKRNGKNGYASALAETIAQTAPEPLAALPA